MPDVEVSVLVPAKDEAANLPLFMELADAAFRTVPDVSFEVVVVDDGSEDDTWAVLKELEARYPFLRLARHRSQRGIADALRTGYLTARGRVLVFYPADLQIKQMIDGETAEEAVLSDDRIVELLKEAGVDIARRTVAKYREAMRIPSSVERRRLLKHAV